MFLLNRSERTIAQHVGRVCWYNNAVRMGFLAVRLALTCCHNDAIIGDGFRTLIQGEAVEYDIARGLCGPFAVNAERSQEAPPGRTSGLVVSARPSVRSTFFEHHNGTSVMNALDA